VTNDAEVARRAWRSWMQEQGLLAQYEQQQRETAREVEQKKQRAADATLAPNKPFFDDPNYKSIFDRDRDRAQKDEQEQYQRANEQRLAEIEAKAARKAQGQTQADFDAIMAEHHARDRIQDL